MAVGIVIMIVIVMLSGGGGGKNSLELVAVCLWGGGAIIVQGRYHAGVFCMVIFTLLIHKYNVIDEIV